MRMAFRHVLQGTATLVLLAGCGASGPAGGGAAETVPLVERFTYAAFGATYEQVAHATLDQMGQVQEFGQQFYLRASAMRAGSAYRITITVDSVPQYEEQGVTEADVAAVVGLTFTGILSSNGEILDLRGGEEVGTPFVEQIRAGLERFFPRIPEAGAAPGDTWTDSLTTTNSGEGIEVEINQVTRLEAVDWVQWDGVRALHVTAVSDYTISGSGEAMGAEFTLAGTGVRREDRYLAADGSYLGGTASDTSNMTALVPTAGMEVPIQQTRSDTLRIVR